MTSVLSWISERSSIITGALGGGLAMLAAVLLFLVATALGPDLPVLKCVGPRARAFMHLTALSWFVRGAMVLTSLSAGDRHPHWDMPVAWSFTVGLCGYAFLYLLGERMPPEVRARFERRELWRRRQVLELVAEGRRDEALRTAAGSPDPGMQQLYELGVDDDTARAWRDLS